MYKNLSYFELILKAKDYLKNISTEDLDFLNTLQEKSPYSNLYKGLKICEKQINIDILDKDIYCKQLHEEIIIRIKQAHSYFN